MQKTPISTIEVLNALINPEIGLIFSDCKKRFSKKTHKKFFSFLKKKLFCESSQMYTIFKVMLLTVNKEKEDNDYDRVIFFIRW